MKLTSRILNAPKLPPFAHKPQPYSGPSYDEVLKLRATYQAPGLVMYYKKPVHIVEGKMQYLFDDTGRRYLDGFAGIVTVSVGHSHPAVLTAMHKQLDKLVHTTCIYPHYESALYAKELLAQLPPTVNGEPWVVQFVNSGSEANDMAMLMARCYTGAFDFLCLRNGYHGMSEGTRGLTALNTWRHAVPTSFGIKHVLCPNTYRGPYGPGPNAGRQYAADVKDTIDHATDGRVAGFICESIQGVGGTVGVPPGYLEESYKHVRAAGGVCISDEVQCGFGRLGTHFWGFQAMSDNRVVPDIITMAKGIANGFPMGAVVARKSVAESMARKIHFNTFGGNPLVAVTARAVLKAMIDDGVQQNSHARGEQFLAGLQRLQAKHQIIGDVRGKGLMLGVELVKDRATKEPATAETAEAFERAKDMGLLLGKGGLYGNVFRIKPPMCISADDVDFSLDVIDRALTGL